ncbi:hypothetical protein FOCC_FOCC007457 [Frankliniella occidentalis]|nr:hypothetical protein FOCC_FOCC007457 [Frankliniella occidentalis]
MQYVLVLTKSDTCTDGDDSDTDYTPKVEEAARNAGKDFSQLLASNTLQQGTGKSIANEVLLQINEYDLEDKLTNPELGKLCSEFQTAWSTINIVALWPATLDMDPLTKRVLTPQAIAKISAFVRKTLEANHDLFSTEKQIRSDDEYLLDLVLIFIGEIPP